MKLRSLIASVAFFAVSASSAFAGPCDAPNYCGSNVDMGQVAVGQSGTITNIYSALFSLPPNVIGSGVTYGLLPTNAQITFNYSFTGLTGGQLTSYSNYNYTNAGNLYQGSSTGDSFSGNNAVGTTNGIASAPLVLATANLNVVNPGNSTGTVRITNLTNTFQQFQSAFFGALSQFPAGVGTITYNVSSVPLPAALPMFTALLASVFGFARFNRNRKAVAA